MDDRQVIRSVSLPASPEEVWRALTDSGMLSSWLGGDVDIDARPSGAISLDDGTELRRGAIDTYIEHERISFIWYVDEEDPTEVVFEIEPAGEATTLRVIERPFVWEFDGADPSRLAGSEQPRMLAGVR